MNKFTPKQEIKDQLATLPQSPGVYIMKDKNDEIIYVGKAKNLSNRVKSYFRGFESHQPKTQTLVVNIKEFDYIITDSETEALILEANLIKKHKPRFNILLKDDKMYPFVVVTNEAFPRIFMSRAPASFKGADIYGPYTSAEAVKTSLEVLHTLYKVRECSKKLGEKKERPCLNYHIGRCLAPCTGNITEEEYQQEFDKFLSFFKGDAEKKRLIDTLEAKMLEYANKMDFENAAIYRDKIASLESLQEKQKAIQNKDTYQDYISGAILGDKSAIMIFFVRGGKLENREVFSMSGGENSDISELISAFIGQYYVSNNDIPPEIYVSHDFEGMQDYADILSKVAGRKVSISKPQKGEKRKITLMLERNAIEYVEKFQKRIQREYEQKALMQTQLKNLLGIPDGMPFSRIEAFDISNTSGVYSVGSMVVFENGSKKKSDYRRYRIKTVEGANDYASMQEVIYRRYRDIMLSSNNPIDKQNSNKISESVLPDLILIDGGKGHVEVAKQILNALGIDVLVAGMVKDDFHKTEDLILNGNRLSLKNHKAAFRLVYEIQEEVHRFAIEYHKSLRNKYMLQTELDEIKGVGEKRRISLLKHFGSVAAIRAAGIEKLCEVEGITGTVAEEIYRFFRSK